MTEKKARLVTDLSDDAAEKIVGGASNHEHLPAHVQAWHGVGPNHQGGQAPGNTASDRHNFDDETAGNSGHNPTAGSNG